MYQNPYTREDEPSANSRQKELLWLQSIDHSNCLTKINGKEDKCLVLTNNHIRRNPPQLLYLRQTAEDFGCIGFKGRQLQSHHRPDITGR